MAQTWTWNETITTPEKTLSIDISFTSNGVAYTSIGLNANGFNTIAYKNPPASLIAYGGGAWKNDAYRTVVFNTNPTGDLLAFLQANAVKQPTDYLTTDVDLSKVADAIRSKTGGTDALVFPDGFVTAIGNIPSGAYNITTTDNDDDSQNLAIVDSGVGLTPATLTINSKDYTGNKYLFAAYFGVDGQIHRIETSTAQSLPITINTVLNSGVLLIPSNWGGLVGWGNNVGCLWTSQMDSLYVVPTSPTASITAYNND